MNVLKHNLAKCMAIAAAACWLAVASAQQAAQKVAVPKADKTLSTQWNGKTVAYLGDSMTDPQCTASTYYYWGYLQELMGIKPLVYGINGHQWTGVLEQAHKLKADSARIDAIFIFAGTNDYNCSVPLGDFFAYDYQTTNKDGENAILRHRTLNTDLGTFAGRINAVMSFLKENYPTRQIVLLTPIHRGYANFAANNVQPDDAWANRQGLFIDDYVAMLKRGAALWSVPVIDLYGESGLVPMLKSNARYFHDKDTDLLHPNYQGQYRLARTVQYRLLALPPSF